MDLENFGAKYAIIFIFMTMNFMHTLNVWIKNLNKKKTKTN